MQNKTQNTIMLIDEIKNLANKIHNSVIGNRRHLHANPELSFHEYKTCAFVKSKLDEMNIPSQFITNTGIVALIKGDQPSDKVIALRADMDALPINEANNIEYKSSNTGVMHACGHDAHTASLLGTAYILQSLKNKFGGTVKLIFQPGEETLPGGASLLIKEGVLENPKPIAIIGQHVMPSLEVGKIAIRKGKFMASVNTIMMTVRGKGGHGAQPHQNIDPVIITANILLAMQQMVSRISNPTTPSVLSFGKLIANGAHNIIPNEVYIEGTFRTVDETWRAEALTRMKQMVEGIAASMGATCEVNVVHGYPYLINEENLTEHVRNYAEEYLGKENVMEAEMWMASEDFAWYSQVASGCFYLLGVGNKEKEITSAIHTPTFNIDEDALAVSTGLMAYVALRELGVDE
jgi:amidohydrolase